MRIWPAAVALARLLSRVGRLDGLRVLDLGCGLGVPGCQAAALGAQVTFVDREADALAFAAWNAAAQGGSALIEAKVMDWSSATVGGPFDLVLLSDVSYHRMHHHALERQLQAAVLPHSLALHADPLREAAGEFLARLDPAFSVSCVSIPQVVEGTRMDVRLALIRSRAAPEGLLDRCRAALAGFSEVRPRSPLVEGPERAGQQTSGTVKMARNAGASDHGTAEHGNAEHGTADHGTADHETADHAPPDPGTLESGGPNLATRTAASPTGAAPPVGFPSVDPALAVDPTSSTDATNDALRQRSSSAGKPR